MAFEKPKTPEEFWELLASLIERLEALEKVLHKAEKKSKPKSQEKKEEKGFLSSLFSGNDDDDE